MDTLVVLGTALLTAAAAALLTPWLRGLLDTRSRWLRRRVTAPLGLAGGALAAAGAASWPELVGLAVLAAGAALLVVSDLAVHRLPHAVVGPLYPILLLALVAAAADTDRWSDLGRSAVAGVVVATLYLVLALIRPADLGVGDIKLSGLVGILLGWLGWPELVLGVLAAFVVGAAVALVLLLSTRTRRTTAFAFGPCMVLGTVLGAVAGPALLPALG